MKTTIRQFLWCILLVGWTHAACDGNRSAELYVSELGIINGQETNYDSWQSAISVRTDAIRCSGTLIHERLVLTAGHCVKLHDEFRGQRYDYDYDEIPDVVSVYGGAFGGMLLGEATRVVVHPDWDGELDLAAADLALILLKSQVQGVAPSRLRDFPLPEEGDTGILVGYGVNVYPDQGSGVHRMGETTIQLVDPYFLGVGGATNTCSGDSGGPLYTQQGGEWVLTGVTSFGLDDCPVDSGGYEINLLSYCDWLNRTLSSLVGEDLGLEHCRACAVQTVSSWGAPCGPGYPCCPEGTLCRSPEGFSQGELGYCAPACCDKGSDVSGECGDVASGTERCAFTDAFGVNYCAIECDSDASCPPGTTCKNKPFQSDSICIATTYGTGETVTCDTELPEDTETAGSSTDSSRPPDTGSSPDPDTMDLPSGDADGDTDGKGKGSHCHAVVSSPSTSLLLNLVRTLVFFAF